MLNIIEPGKRPILRSDFFILFAFCRSAEGGDEFPFLLSSSKDSTNRSNDVGNLSIFAGHFAEKEPLIKEMKQAIKAFNFHLSKGYKKKKHDIWENWSMTSLIVPVLLVLAQIIFISPHFTGLWPENRQRENNKSSKWSFSFFRWLASTCFSAQWLEYSHYRQYPLTGGKILGIKYTRHQVQGIK